MDETLFPSECNIANMIEKKKYNDVWLDAKSMELEI